MPDVVVFGAGLVAPAHVRYLLDHGFSVTLADQDRSRAEAVIDGHPSASAVQLDVCEDPSGMDELITGHRLAVSLLPYVFHPRVAEACIAHKKHMVTTSYVSDTMKAFDGKARAAGVTLLNEIGVDPGIDHMTAMKVIDGARKKGGEITSFISYCGGLPAPNSNDNPFGYKFSWSPKGVLLAGKNAAHFRRDGVVVEIAPNELFDNTRPISIDAGHTQLELQGYPNRDSLPYQEVYGIQPKNDMFRGTLRYPGWCETIKAISAIGLLEETETDGLDNLTFGELTARCLGNENAANVREDVAKLLNIGVESEIISRLDWLGLFGDEPIPKGSRSVIDALAGKMANVMCYSAGQQDMLVLQHEFVVEYGPESNEPKAERILSTMIDFGVPDGDSSMARTVGLPSAIGARLILEGRIHSRGVLVPVIPEIYEPVLAELTELGITFEERAERIAHNPNLR